MTSPRPSLARGFILELDGLRGLAILLVMVHRFWPRSAVGTAADVAGAGWIGVDLFFVISGFLIAGILLDTRGDTGYFRNFYARRMLRIFPLYYAFVIAVWIGFGSNPAFREHAGSPLWYLFHLGNVPEGVFDNDVPYWLAPTWSLAIEEQFYLTFPLLVYFLDRRKLTIVLVGMLLAAPAFRAVTTIAWPDHERLQYLFTFSRIDTIAIGCLLAIVVRTFDVERWRARAQLVAFATLPGVVVLAVASGLDRTSPFDRVVGYSVVAAGCASIVALVVLSRGRPSTALLRWAPITYLGKLCLGLYLLHRPADTLVTALGARIGFERGLWLLPIKVGVAVVFATLSWKLLERPFLRLKDRFTSRRHPNAVRAIGVSLVVVMVAVAACGTPPPPTGSLDASAGNDGVVSPHDGALLDDANPDRDAPSDGAVSGSTTILYPEGRTHSPITTAISSNLSSIAATNARDGHVFAKVGDSITAATDFLYCFDGGTVDLGSHGDLAPTIAHFRQGQAAGASPYLRDSDAAEGGTTSRDAMTGTPSPLDRELAAIDPQIAVVLFGTNEARYGWTLDAYATALWELVDRTIAQGVVPIVSTMPANNGDADANAKVPTFNRAVRAIAQGRGIPLVDLHHELAPLPNRGMASDGLHPSVSPSGACVLTDAGLQYGYNVRNLITIAALKRVVAALAGTASDSAAPVRTGEGTAASPYASALPLVDLGDVRRGEAKQATHGCGGASTSGRELVYRLSLASPTTIAAHVVDRGAVDVDIHIITGGTCRAAGDLAASALVGPGPVDIVVDAKTASSEGEFLLVVEAR